MNSDFYDNLDTNFEKACDMYDRTFTHDELICMLRAGNIPQKQFAALNIQELNNYDEMQIFMNNLTGCDGKIREAIAFKLREFLQKDNDYYASLLYMDLLNMAKILSDATIDINANIARLVVECVKKLKNNSTFCTEYVKNITVIIDIAFDNLDKIIFRDKKYTINKQLFKLYWCLEVLKYFTDFIDKNKLYKILERASKESEYTIREKVSQILIEITDEKFIELKNALIMDENYYVRKVFV